MIKKNILTVIGVVLLASSALGAKSTKQTDASNTTQSQKIVDEYKEYVAKILPEVREEIITYRKEISRINRLKRETYQKLSQEAQNYLAKEQEFRKKLPIKNKKLINISDENNGKSTK